MISPPIMQAVRQFCSTTTLHGLKYLCSKSFFDRVCWMLCCCASACCAGLLCGVLWERFTEVPALITLHDLRADRQILRLSNIAICPTSGNIADLFQRDFITDEEIREGLPIIINVLLERKPLMEVQVAIFERALAANNLTLTKALFELTPSCGNIIRNCRWLSMTIPCYTIFQKEMTQWGVCCVMRPDQLQLSSTLKSHLSLSRTLNIGVQLSNDTTIHENRVRIFTKYPGEEWVEPTILNPGNNYFGSLTFTSIVDSNVEKLVNDRCVFREHYTKSGCMINCVENLCGCSDPLKANSYDIALPALPTCSLATLNCLRTFKYDNLTCNCLPSCKKVSTDVAWDSSPMDVFEYAYDNVYAGLNASLAIVLNLHIRVSASKKYIVNPTETWITLLSSLGGVFNMFLGVGLFSALEFLFLLFIKLPIALRKSAEMAATRKNLL